MTNLIMAYAELAVQRQVDSEVLAVVQVVELFVTLVELSGLVELVVLHLPFLLIIYASVNVYILILPFSVLS